MGLASGLLAAGTALSVYSQIQEGKAVAEAAKDQGRATSDAATAEAQAAEALGISQEEIANRNAAQAISEAEGKRQAASEAAIQREREGKALKSKQVAGFAKSGVELRGSPLSVLVETAQDTEADRLTILREGAIAGASDEFRAGTLTAQGRAAKLRGLASSRVSRSRGLAAVRSARATSKAAKRSSVLSAIGTGLSGGAKVAASLQKDKDRKKTE